MHQRFSNPRRIQNAPFLLCYHNHLNKLKIYDYYEYERVREKKYPSIKDQLDALYHDIKNGKLNDGEWIKSIDEIKKGNPKPDIDPPSLST